MNYSYAYIPSFLDFLPIQVTTEHSTAPWAIQQVLIGYFYIVKVKVLATQSCLTLRSSGLQPTGLHCPWDSPDKNTGVGSHSLLQGIFPTQGMITALQANYLPSEPPRKPFYIVVYIRQSQSPNSSHSLFPCLMSILIFIQSQLSFSPMVLTRTEWLSFIQLNDSTELKCSASCQLLSQLPF